MSKKDKKAIPASILKALADRCSDSFNHNPNMFEELLESHKHLDEKEGCTCIYNLSSLSHTLTYGQLIEIIKEGAIPKQFYSDSNNVNQHWLHSIEQFFSNCAHEWQEHLKRIESIKNTPAGRIKNG